MVEAAIGASARDVQDAEDSMARFAQFLIANAAPRLTDTNLAPCKQVVREFERLERHYDAYTETHAAVGNSSSPAYRSDEGE